MQGLTFIFWFTPKPLMPTCSRNKVSLTALMGTFDGGSRLSSSAPEGPGKAAKLGGRPLLRCQRKCSGAWAKLC